MQGPGVASFAMSAVHSGTRILRWTRVRRCEESAVGTAGMVQWDGVRDPYLLSEETPSSAAPCCCCCHGTHHCTFKPSLPSCAQSPLNHECALPLASTLLPTAAAPGVTVASDAVACTLNAAAAPACACAASAARSCSDNGTDVMRSFTSQSARSQR